MSSLDETNARLVEVSAGTMRFIRQLAADVSGPPLQLPSYPEVALRLQRVLGDVNASSERVAKVIACDAMLAARVTTMANSAALNRSNRAVTDLPTAISVLGFDTLRTTAISFAVAQLRKATAYRSIEKQMGALWQQSVDIAATGFVLSRRLRCFAPDAVMLAGLVSTVGKLYILTRSTQFPEIFADPTDYERVVRQWHTQVARSILENWQVVPEIVDAIVEMDEAPDDKRTKLALSDLLVVADVLTRLKDLPETLYAELRSNNCAVRMGLNAQASVALLDESAAEVASLREALGL